MTTKTETIAYCVTCGRKFLTRGTLAGAIREAQGLDAGHNPNTGVGVCSVRCMFARIAKYAAGKTGEQ
jgi:hypothetical protein